MSRGWCAVCRSGYRNWAVHASTETHRAKQYRANNPRSSERRGHKALARAAAWRRARRAGPATARDAGLVDVRKHRRGWPWTGTLANLTKYRPGSRPVRVPRHWRGWPDPGGAAAAATSRIMAEGAARRRDYLGW